MLKWFRRGSSPAAEKPALAPAAPASPASPASPATDPDALMREAFPLHEAGNVAAAEALYRQILGIAPDYADAHYLLGRIAQERGNVSEALRHLREAVRCNDREAAFHKTLGEIHFGLGHWQEAIVYLGKAVERQPADFESWNNLGCACEKLGKLAEATRHFRRALELSPESPMALNNVAMSLKDRGRADEAIESFRQARERLPEDTDLFSNYLYTLNFSTRVTPTECFEAHLEFDRAFGTGRFGTRAWRSANPDPERRLRIGYFSPDLRSHPVSVFMDAPLRLHDRAAFEVSCYYLHPWSDAVTERLRQQVDRWTDCRGMSDAQVAARIEADGIDILVDLAGHTGGNRPAVLGRKPAPVIATWLGYPNTTGLRTVDYRITDARSDPEGLTDRYNTEKLLRLPQQWCYARPSFSAEVTALPAARSGQVRFGSFNNASKLNDDMARLWAAILQRIDGARLLVWGVGDEQREHIRAVCGETGLDPARLDFSDRTGFTEQVLMYQQVDIALDTHPYSGVTTTFNSLWMGVPVVTLPGQTSASRSTHAIQDTLGLGDWSARSAADYVELAVAKARDLESLAHLRARLRSTLEGSPFMDGPGFTQRLEEAYRAMWRAHCAAAAA